MNPEHRMLLRTACFLLALVLLASCIASCQNSCRFADDANGNPALAKECHFNDKPKH